MQFFSTNDVIYIPPNIYTFLESNNQHFGFFLYLERLRLNHQPRQYFERSTKKDGSQQY